MNLLRVLWALYRGPSKDPRHQPRLVAVVGNEVPRQSRLQAKFWEWFWRLYFRSSRVPLRVFRVIYNQGDLCSRWIIYQHPESNRSLHRSYRSSAWQFAADEKQLIDLDDAWNAVNALRSPLPVRPEEWETDPSDSIDEACEMGEACLEDLQRRAMAISKLTGEVPDEEEGLTSPDLPPTSAFPDQDNDYDERARDRYSDLCKMARAKNVHWKSMEPTPAGHQCDILVSDHREQHLL